MRLVLVAVAIATAVLGAASSIVIARQGRGGGEAPPVLIVEKLQDDLFVLRSGPRAHSGVFIGQRGVTIVDVRGGWGPNRWGTEEKAEAGGSRMVANARGLEANLLADGCRDPRSLAVQSFLRRSVTRGELRRSGRWRLSTS